MAATQHNTSYSYKLGIIFSVRRCYHDYNIGTDTYTHGSTCFEAWCSYIPNYKSLRGAVVKLLAF